MFFDGEFNIKVASVGERKEAEEAHKIKLINDLRQWRKDHWAKKAVEFQQEAVERTEIRNEEIFYRS